jgi:type IV pilus assembly protein PilV
MKPRNSSKNLKSLSPSGIQRGFALLEALIAILIFSIGILSMVGMQATAARYSTDAQFRSTAAYLASQCLAQIRVASRTSTATMKSACPDSASLPELPNSSRAVTVAGDPLSGYDVTVAIDWKLPGDTATHEHKVVTNIHDRCDTTGCS